jgi:hypothetical protein
MRSSQRRRQTTEVSCSFLQLEISSSAAAGLVFLFGSVAFSLQARPAILPPTERAAENPALI